MKRRAPSCASFADESAVVRFERDVRVHRAHVEAFAVEILADDVFVVRGVSVNYLCAEAGIERELEATSERKRAMRNAAVDADSEVDALSTYRASLTLPGLVVEDEALDPGDEGGSHGAVLHAVEAAAHEAPMARLDHARQRLRLAQIVLTAGYPGDAVRAALEALSASSSLLPAAERAASERLPLHELASAAERGEAVDREQATAAVADAAEWLERADRIALTSARRPAARSRR